MPAGPAHLSGAVQTHQEGALRRTEAAVAGVLDHCAVEVSSDA